MRADRLAIWSMVKVPSAGIEDGYVPLKPAETIHFHPARLKLVAGAARVGKSLLAAMEGLVWTPYSNLLWFVGPDYNQTRPEFIYLMEALRSLGWLVEGSVSMPSTVTMGCSMRTIWGCHIQTKTSADVEKISGYAPDVLIACEAGQMVPAVLFRFYERLTTRRGLLLLIGTFERSQPWYADLWQKWREYPNDEGGKSFSIPMWANIHTFPGGVNDPEIQRLAKAIPDRAIFLSRIAGLPATSYDLVFGPIWKPMLPNGEPYHVRHVPFRRWTMDGPSKVLCPVELAIDPGFRPSKYAVAVMQWDDKDTYQIDEVVMREALHSHVIQECQRRPWWPNVTAGIMDPFAATSHVFGAISPASVWDEEARIPIYTPPRVSIEDAIERHAFYLYDPYQDRPRHFVDEGCTETIYEYSHWQRTQDRGTGNLRGHPVDRNCDVMKAKSAWFAYHFQIRERAGLRLGPTVHELRFVEV
jgi:hypothetical protein